MGKALYTLGCTELSQICILPWKSSHPIKDNYNRVKLDMVLKSPSICYTGVAASFICPTATMINKYVPTIINISALDYYSFTESFFCFKKTNICHIPTLCQTIYWMRSLSLVSLITILLSSPFLWRNQGP